MRLLFALLLVANVAFFAYSKWLRAPDQSGELIPKLQVNPDRIRIIGVGERARVSQATRPAEACLEWGTIAGADVARADAAVAALDLPGVALQRTLADAAGYWVYVPAARTKAEVDRRVAAIKARGVREVYVVQDAGPWRNAISLGIFKSEEAARAMAERLKGDGVRGIEVERREHLLKQVVYRVREPDEKAVAHLAQLQRDFPGTEVKAVPCPPGAPGPG